MAKANKALFIFNITCSLITLTLYSYNSLKFVAENENENSYLEDNNGKEEDEV